MDELIATTVTDLISYPPKPAIHEKMTFEAMIYALDWNDNNPDPASCLAPEERTLIDRQLPTKVDGYAQWLDKLADDAKRAREYARKFAEYARQIDARTERHLGHIKRVMETHHFEKMPGDAFQVSIRKNPPSVVTTRPPTAEDALSDRSRFVKTTIKYEWDKPSIKEAQKAGEDLDFAYLEQSTRVQFDIRKG